MENSTFQHIRNWAQGRAGRFLLTQLAHTVITIVVLAILMAGAGRAGALAGVFAPAASTSATNFTTVNYQGRLADSGGNPIDNTNPGLGMTFALYDVDTGGSSLWSETHANVPVSQGLFSVRLGSIDALSTELLNGDRWLGIQVGTDPEMAPREKLAAVPYAISADRASSADLLNGILDGEEKQISIQSGQVENTDTPSPEYIIVTYPQPFRTGTIPRVIISANNQSGR